MGKFFILAADSAPLYTSQALSDRQVVIVYMVHVRGPQYDHFVRSGFNIQLSNNYRV